MKLNIYNQKGEIKGSLELKDDIFGVKPNVDLIHQAMVAQLSNERQVFAHTKTRAEVRGGGKKPWRQKGTGRARHGSSRSPIWIGGGITFGPRSDRNFSVKINKKMKRSAIFMILSDRIISQSLAIVEKPELKEVKTKKFNEILKVWENKIWPESKRKESTLLIVESLKEGFVRAGKNLSGLEILNLDNINLLDLLKNKRVIFTEEAVKKFEKIYK